MPPHVLYVLGEPAALGQVGSGHREDPSRHRCGSAHPARIAADLVAVGASVSGLAVGIVVLRTRRRSAPAARPWRSSDPAM
jgi:hypothetical protein